VAADDPGHEGQGSGTTAAARHAWCLASQRAVTGQRGSRPTGRLAAAPYAVSSHLTEAPVKWWAFEEDGFNTAFCFPFGPGLGPDKQTAVAEILLSLPLTRVLFLKHLEHVGVSVDRRGRQEGRSWRIRGNVFATAGEVSPGLVETGLYRVTVATDDGESATFLLAHDADIEILSPPTLRCAGMGASGCRPR
jgi:hypothetical protein